MKQLLAQKQPDACMSRFIPNVLAVGPGAPGAPAEAHCVDGTSAVL